MRHTTQRGLTLVEIVIVLIIISVLGSFLAGKVLGQGDKQKAQITKLKMKEVKAKIEEFQLRYNSLPNNIDALTGCNDQTGSDCIAIAEPAQLRDAWDTPLQFRAAGDRRYVLRSLGADKKEGGSGVDGDISEEGP